MIVTVGWGRLQNQWVEARDAAKHPTEPRTRPHSEELSGSNVSAEAEESWCREGLKLETVVSS